MGVPLANDAFVISFSTRVDIFTVLAKMVVLRLFKKRTFGNS
jgi:hypothetical protein